jgi:hypothetical protein
MNWRREEIIVSDPRIKFKPKTMKLVIAAS